MLDIKKKIDLLLENAMVLDDEIHRKIAETREHVQLLPVGKILEILYFHTKQEAETYANLAMDICLGVQPVDHNSKKESWIPKDIEYKVIIGRLADEEVRAARHYMRMTQSGIPPQERRKTVTGDTIH